MTLQVINIIWEKKDTKLVFNFIWSYALFKWDILSNVLFIKITMRVIFCYNFMTLFVIKFSFCSLTNHFVVSSFLQFLLVIFLTLSAGSTKSFMHSTCKIRSLTRQAWSKKILDLELIRVDYFSRLLPVARRFQLRIYLFDCFCWDLSEALWV